MKIVKKVVAMHGSVSTSVIHSLNSGTCLLNVDIRFRCSLTWEMSLTFIVGVAAARASVGVPKVPGAQRRSVE